MNGSLLSRARKRSKKTQREIAEALGMSVQAISQWELGQRNIPGAKLEEITKLYGLTEGEKDLVSSSEKCMGREDHCLSEYQIFYGLLMLPEDARDRVIRAMKAYESVKD